jgi:hypothetical protein
MLQNALSKDLKKEFKRCFILERKKKHTLKYEVAVSLRRPNFVWAAGPVAGSVHDFTLTQEKGLLNRVLPYERVLADMGYIGDYRIITPFKRNKKRGNPIHMIWNKALGALRVKVEHVFNRVKIFEALKQAWRHKLYFHKIVFYVIVNILSIELLIHPVKKK